MLRRMQQQQRQQEAMMDQYRKQLEQNQQLVAAMLRRMDSEEKRRNDAELAAAEAKAKAEAAKASAPSDPFLAATSSTGSSFPSSSPKDAGSSSGGYVSNRADKYLPQLPVIAHQEMGRDRMREIEAWHGFLETMSSWLALQDEAYVNELRLCISVKDEIRQDRLPPDTAARSAKLFYLLSQSLAKWERGLELLRSCSKRQSMSATGYEAVRTLHLNYSIVSRMEAVYVRDGCMKLHAQCSGLRRPMDIIRHLEDEIAKAEIKLSNFPELKLSEADRCSILLQAVSHPARQYVALHGNAHSWSELTKSLKYFEEQLRMCDVPTAANRGMDGKLCDHCGKHGHVAKDCWVRQREAGEKGGKGGQGESKSGKGTGGPKGQRSPTSKGAPRSPTPEGKPNSKGEKGEKGEKGKDKGKNKKNRARAMGEPESEAEAVPTQSVVAMRFAQRSPELSLSESHERRVGFSLDKQRLGPVSNSLNAGDVERICASFQLEPRDVWLVDSGATCHVVSSEHLSGFRVVKSHEREVTLYNASGGKIPVSDVVDLEVVFGNCSLLLTEVLVAEVTFNAISPWAAVEKGWRTYLYKTGSRLYKGKRNVKLVSANRAWWALSGGRRQKAGKGSSPRQPSGSDMEIDAITCLQDTVVKPQPGPSILKKATTGGKKAEEVEKPQGRESGDCRHALLETPFAFLLRGLRAEVSPKVVPKVPQECTEHTPKVPENTLKLPEMPKEVHKEQPKRTPQLIRKPVERPLACLVACLLACFVACLLACGAACFSAWCFALVDFERMEQALAEQYFGLSQLSFGRNHGGACCLEGRRSSTFCALSYAGSVTDTGVLPWSCRSRKARTRSDRGGRKGQDGSCRRRAAPWRGQRRHTYVNCSGGPLSNVALDGEGISFDFDQELRYGGGLLGRLGQPLSSAHFCAATRRAVCRTGPKLDLLVAQKGAAAHSLVQGFDWRAFESFEQGYDGSGVLGGNGGGKCRACPSFGRWRSRLLSLWIHRGCSLGSWLSPSEGTRAQVVALRTSFGTPRTPDQDGIGGMYDHRVGELPRAYPFPTYPGCVGRGFWVQLEGHYHCCGSTSRVLDLEQVRSPQAAPYVVPPSAGPHLCPVPPWVGESVPGVQREVRHWPCGKGDVGKHSDVDPEVRLGSYWECDKERGQGALLPGGVSGVDKSCPLQGGSPTPGWWERLRVVLLRWFGGPEQIVRGPGMDGTEYPQRSSGKAIGAPGNHGGRLLEPPHCAGGAGWNSGASIGSTVGNSYASANPSFPASPTPSGVGIWRKQLRGLEAFGIAVAHVTCAHGGIGSRSFEKPTKSAALGCSQRGKGRDKRGRGRPSLKTKMWKCSSVAPHRRFAPRQAKREPARRHEQVGVCCWHETVTCCCLSLSLACLTCCGMETFWLGNLSLEAPEVKRHLVVGPLREIGGSKPRVERTPFHLHARRSAKIPGLVINVAMVFIILIFSALVGVGVSGIWKLLKKVCQRGSKRAPEMSRIKPRKGGCWIRIRTRKCFKRVCVERIVLVGRKSPKAPTKGKPKTLKLLACLRHVWHVWHVLACCLDVACLLLKGNDEKVPEGGLKQPVTGHLRMLRGLLLPRSGTCSDPLILDRDDGEPSFSLNQPNCSPQNPEQPPETPIPQGAEIEERLPLRSHALQVHRSRSHFPYEVKCESCGSRKGKVPSRRLKRQLHEENQTIGVDFFYFGNLRVLLLVHVASRYSMSIPAMELHDPNLLLNIDRFIREIGLHQKTLGFRCDNEQGLISMCERVASQRRENPTIVDVVPGYRPQSKGAVERQVSAMKQGFWSIWLDLEAEIKRRRPAEEGSAAWQLPLGGMLWQTCLLYAARSFNLWSFDSNNSTTAIDRLHEEIVQRTRTLPFGCSAQAKVGGSKRHLEKFRGAKTVRVSYLGPVHPRGGGVYGTVIGGDGEIEVFPACRGIFERDEPTYDSPTLELLAKANPLVLDTQDPEKPLLFEPPAEPIVPRGEEIEAPEDEEMIPEYVQDYEPTEMGSEGHEGVAGGDLPEPDMEDMEIDWLTDHYLQKLGEGPDCRAVSNQAASSFELKFGGSRSCCQVPQQAASETSGGLLDPKLLYLSIAHIELRAVFLQQLVAEERLTLGYIPGKRNPADALTKSPTLENLVSLCEDAALIIEPESWSSISKESVKEVRNEPNITEEVSSNAVRSSPLEVPSSRTTSDTVPLAIACALKKGIAYFGVTREVNLLSRNIFLALKEVLRVLKQGKVRVFAPLSTLCSSGCPLRYLRFRKRRGLELCRKTIKTHKSYWRLIGKLFGPYTSNEGLLLTHEWPGRSSLWKETVFLEVSKGLGLTQGCLVDRCCFEKREKTWKRWWFAASSAACGWKLSSYVCAGNHEHSKSASLKDSGTYPEELGKALVRIGKKILKQEERQD